MMKNLLLIFSASILLFQAQAKKRCLKAKAIKVVNATYSLKTRGIVGGGGTIYTFEIKTGSKNLVVDSVWFGYTPVPCDLYKNVNDFRIDKTSEKGTYFVRANKSLYSIYANTIDSTQSFKSFKPAIPFEGVAMIMYRENGKRKYEKVKSAIQVKEKELRQ